MHRLRLSALAVLMASAAACDHAVERRYTDIDAVIADGPSFNGRKIVLKGCLEANQHGLVMSSCPSGRQRLVVLPSDELEASRRSLPYAEALTSKIQHHRPLAVTLCGTYRQTPDGQDCWLDVDAFAIDADTSDPVACWR